MANLAEQPAAMQPPVHSVHAARSQLSRLIESALRGEQVVTARGGKPVVRLVPLPLKGFRFGVLKGRVGTPPDFLEPMGEEEPCAWEGR